MSRSFRFRISQFFVDLGYPLRNIRWSWGARNGDSLLLRTWEDEYAFKERRLIVLDRPELYRPSESFGLDERIVQLRAFILTKYSEGRGEHWNERIASQSE